MESARALIEVQAGVLPNHAEPELTRQWALTSREWEEHGEAALLTYMDAAHDYTVELLPDRVNWTRLDVVWL